MNWFIGPLVYIVLWWMVLVTILPIGNRPAEKVEPGHAEGVPTRPRLRLKALIATVVAAVLWGVIYWVIASGVITVQRG